MARSTRWLLGVMAGVLGLVVLAVAVALTAGGEADLDPATPGGAVQTYLRAVSERDAEGAWTLFASDLQDRCPLSSVRDALRYGPRDFRAQLGEVVPRTETTDVIVSITERYGGGLFGNESTFEQVFPLTQEDGAWRLAEAPWPLWCPPEPIR